MATYQKIAVDHPTYMNNGDFFTMSGTSQAAGGGLGCRGAGAVRQPGLTPDQVKCRIIASGRPAVDADGSSPTACCSRAPAWWTPRPPCTALVNNCANQGLNIAADIAGTQHFMGHATQLRRRQLPGHRPERLRLRARVISGTRATLWATATSGRMATSGRTVTCGPRASPTPGDIPWVDGYPSPIGTSVGTTTSMSVNSWVAPE